MTLIQSAKVQLFSFSLTQTNNFFISTRPNGCVAATLSAAYTLPRLHPHCGLSFACHLWNLQKNSHLFRALSVSPKQTTLKVQETGTILANVLPTDAADKSVIWESSDDLVVKVDENGNLTAISGGTAKVYAVSVFDNSIKDFCEVTVLQPVTGISLNENTIEITEDGSFKLIATVLPDKAANKGVKWTSSDMSVAVVSGDGTVFGIKAGNATFMATTDDGGFVALCKVKVAKGFVPVSDISLN